MVNVKDASCSLMMGIRTKELDELPSPGLMFFHTSSQEILQTEHITYEKNVPAQQTQCQRKFVGGVPSWLLQQKLELVKNCAFLTIDQHKIPS